MEEKLSGLIDILSKAKQGDKEALEFLRLENDLEFDTPRPFDPQNSINNMKEEICDMAYLVGALGHCHMTHCEKVARKALSYALYVYEIIFDKRCKVVGTLSGQDVAEECLQIVTDVCNSTDMLLQANRSLEEGPPKGEEEYSEGGDSEEEQPEEVPRGGEGDKESDREQQEEVPRGEGDEESDTEEEEHEIVPRGGEKPSSHHLSRRCMVGKCRYFGPNLKRHLANVHLKKNEIVAEDVERYFHLATQTSGKRGPLRKDKKGKTLKGRIKKWCPEPFCNYLGAYLRVHLQKKHKMKQGSQRYKMSLKVARRYTGLEDELSKMIQPQPAIVEISAASSPSKRVVEVDSDSDVELPKSPAKKSKHLTESVSSSECVIPPTPKKKPSSSISPRTTSATHASKEDSDISFDEDFDRDEEDVYVMKEDYFNEENPTTNRHRWLVAFYKHLITPAAGYHKDRNRLQHAAQVKKILTDIDPYGGDVTILAEDEGNRVWLDWVIPSLDSLAGGTIKSYLTSLQKFVEFLAKKGARPHLPTIASDMRDTFEDLVANLRGWRRYITKETSSARWSKYISECDTLLTKQEVEDIMNSGPAVEGRRAIVAAESAASPAELTLQQYGAARDLLIVSLTRAVGTRPGALERATLGMFQTARWDEKKTKKVMLVTSHKRQEDGPAPIPMEPDMLYLMESFINKMRPRVSQDQSPSANIFLKSDGAPYHRGTIGKRISAFIVKSGIRADKPISATDFRKWIVTEMQRKKRSGMPVDEELLRKLMCHSDRTAKNWYLRESLTEEAAQASHHLNLVTQVTQKKKSPEKELPDPESPSKINKSFSATDVSHAESEAETDPVSLGSNSLSNRELQSVNKIFSEDISQGISPRKKRVVALMKSDIVLRPLVQSQVKVKKVVDRVRYLMASRPQVDPYALPEEDKSTRTANYVLSNPHGSLLSVESGRVEWSEEETRLLERAVLSYEKVPRQTEIRRLFHSSDELKKIYDNNTFERIRNKLKNILRKRNR